MSSHPDSILASGTPDLTVPIPHRALGAEFGHLRETLTKRRTMAFAAGIGRDDELFLDDTRAGGVTAPPGIVAALEWPTFVTTSYLTAVGRNTSTAFNGLVHGFHISDFIRPLRPGDDVETSGRIVELKQTPAGTLVTACLTIADRKDNLPVSVSWFGAMYRSTPLDGNPGKIEEVPQLRPEKGLSGSADFSQSLWIPKGQAHVYTECADIWNPIHTEREYALASGLSDIILHGTCTWCKTMHVLADEFVTESATLPFKRFGARFSAPVFPGTQITVESTRPKRGEIAFCVRRQDGEFSLTNGIAILA